MEFIIYIVNIHNVTINQIDVNTRVQFANEIADLVKAGYLVDSREVRFAEGVYIQLKNPNTETPTHRRKT